MAGSVEFLARITPATPRRRYRLTIDGIEPTGPGPYVGRPGAAIEMTVDPVDGGERLEAHWSLWPTALKNLPHGFQIVARNAGSDSPLEFPPLLAAENPPAPDTTAPETTAQSSPVNDSPAAPETTAQTGL